MATDFNVPGLSLADRDWFAALFHDARDLTLRAREARARRTSNGFEANEMLVAYNAIAARRTEVHARFLAVQRGANGATISAALGAAIVEFVGPVRALAGEPFIAGGA